MNLLIIFGGQSAEHEVSRASASSILKNINKNKYNIICIGITKNGEWFLTNGNENEILDGSWEYRGDNRKAVLLPDAKVKGVLTEDNNLYNVDCVWPILHGKNGEDGTIQGLCELANLKYVGPDVFSSAICMDKTITKVVIGQTNIKQADYYITYGKDYFHNQNKILTEVEKKFKGIYPLFVKPATSGSSVGISKVRNREELKRAYNIAFDESKKVLVEEAIDGQEVEVAVLGNNDPEASRVGEVLSGGEWYDYSSKYKDNKSRTLIPAKISKSIEEEIQKAALEIYKLLGCKVLSRVDFFVDKSETVIFNEINTLPGFTDISMYPLLWQAVGITYTDLIDKIISYALESD